MNTINIDPCQESLISRANKVLPAGSFGNMPGNIVLERGKAGRVWDINKNEYVDFLLGSGPMFIGHAHPDVTKAIIEQAPRGTTFFANNQHGIKLAETICDAVACADQLRFVSSGSEATLYAMRLARAYRKRDKILKFEGGYHGMSDYALMSLAPKRLTNYPQPVPDSAGIPRQVSENIIIAPFNDKETVESLINEYHDELGGVIIEPFQRLIPPEDGFLEMLREITFKYSIPLIFDEIVTGFRFSYGGAQEYYNVTPDLCTLGKIIGGGFPVAAICGRSEIMRHFDKALVGEENFLPQIGTLSGNPLASVAGLATLDVLKSDLSYKKVFDTGRQLMEGLRVAMRNNGHIAEVIGEPPLFDVFFSSKKIRNYRDILQSDAKKAIKFNQLLRERKVFKGDSKFYISAAHDQDDIDLTILAMNDAAEELKKFSFYTNN